MMKLYDFDIPIKTCPICNKQYVRYKDHVYKVGAPSKKIHVCSYNCQITYEKEYGEKTFTQTNYHKRKGK